LPIYLFLLLLDFSLYIPGVHSSNVFSRAIRTTHRIAARHTKDIARDLRLAFGAVLISDPKQNQLGLISERSVYCSVAGNGLGSGTGSGSGTSNSSGSGSTSSSTSSASASPSASAISTPWKLVEEHNGSDFFEGWTFFTAADPTDGVVDYLDASDAASANLAYVNSAGAAIMAVDTTDNITGNRKSVRITTNSQYSLNTIWILHSTHMPTGCGTWPAFWTNGPNWPNAGEIDIVEGVNAYTQNTASIHTDPGCSLPSNNSTVLGITGTVTGSTDCSAAQTSDQGCGILDQSSNVSFGAAFNNNGGGVYASKLDDTGVSVHFWPAGQVPSDVLAGTPLPSSWGTPLASWPATDCDPSTFFYNHSAIFDTTLCGEWAGEVWNTTNVAGQTESCAQLTGYSTCDAYVMAEGSGFSEAYWEVQSVQIFQNESS